MVEVIEYVTFEHNILWSYNRFIKCGNCERFLFSCNWYATRFNTCAFGRLFTVPYLSMRSWMSTGRHLGLLMASTPIPTDILACVAGGSGCKNSLAGLAREGISGFAAKSFTRAPTPASYAGYGHLYSPVSLASRDQGGG